MAEAQEGEGEPLVVFGFLRWYSRDGYIYNLIKA
jgi:hypothetical protein